MGRTQVFKGLTLITPDAYSALDLSRLLTPTSGGTGIVALVGESDGGAPGLHVYPGGISPSIVQADLVSGPGADMARLALRSGSDPLVQAGASTVLFYKTNNSTQSQLVVGAIAAVAEVRQFVTRSDVGGDLTDTYLDNLYDGQGNGYYIWYDNGTGTDPLLSGKTAIQVVYTNTDTANTIATLTRAAVAAVTGVFTAGGTGAQVIITNVNTGAAVDLVDGAVATGFTGISTTTQGVSGDAGIITIKTKQYGAFTALYTASLSNASGSTFLTITDQNGVPEVSVGVGANAYGSVNRSTAGGCIAADVRLLYVANRLRLQGNQNLGAGLVSAFDLDVTDLSMSQVKTLVEAFAGWTMVIAASQDLTFRAVNLDVILTAQNCFSTTSFALAASAYELVLWSQQTSKLVEVSRGTQNEAEAVPTVLAATLMTGGTRGTTTNSNVQAALNALLKIRVNILVPLFSSDAQDGSSVTASAIFAQVKSHVESRSSILGRSECQAYLGFKGNKTAFKAQCQTTGSRWVAVTSHQVTDLDISGNVKKFDEYAFAVVCAQTQAGSPVGTPLTNRLIPVIGINQDISWDPIANGPEMILAGALIAGLDENNQIKIINGYTSWLADTNNANIYIETVESLAVFAFNHRLFMKERFLGQSSFTQQDVLDAIAESVNAEKGTTRSIKGFDLTQTKIISTTAGRLEYELAVIPFEGIVFVLPTVVAIREEAA